MDEITGRYPRILAEQVTLLWHDRFWDGPCNGVCLYQGRKYYYGCFEEAEDGSPWYRRFALYELTPEQLADEEFWHELFREKVGTHWEPGGSLKPKELHREFYDAYQKRREPHYEENNPIVGWFEW